MLSALCIPSEGTAAFVAKSCVAEGGLCVDHLIPEGVDSHVTPEDCTGNVTKLQVMRAIRDKGFLLQYHPHTHTQAYVRTLRRINHE